MLRGIQTLLRLLAFLSLTQNGCEKQ
ncbi:putative lipoprotein, partial [Vibrio parahaemolyticus VPTS-2010_2]